MKKPFTVHKNTAQKRKLHDTSMGLVSDAKGMSDGKDVIAYAIVALRQDGRAMCAWDTGGAIPMWAFPQTVQQVVASDMEQSGISDDFKKPVLDKSWRGNT